MLNKMRLPCRLCRLVYSKHSGRVPEAAVAVHEARQHIARARRQLERVQVAAWDRDDPEEAVTWAFYAYENCVAALAERFGRKWTRNHREKADLARKLHAEGLISRDIGDELEELNGLRKDVAYGEPGPELAGERPRGSWQMSWRSSLTRSPSRIGSSK